MMTYFVPFLIFAALEVVSSTHEVSACVDDVNFKVEGVEGKGCTWVGEKRKKRCSMGGDGAKTIIDVNESCPETCKKCPPAFENDNIVICTDNPNFRYKNNKAKSCYWVAERRKRYCKRKKIRKNCQFACKVKKCNTAKTLAPSYAPSVKQDDRALQGKKGVCMTLREEGTKGSYIENLPKLRALNPYWCYSWGTQPAKGVPTLPSNAAGPKIPAKEGSTDIFIDYVPMLWGYYAEKFEKSLEEIKQQNPRVFLGFNEPDSKKQSNMSVQTAIDAWPELVTQITKDYSDNDDVPAALVVSPSCVHPLGTWFESFMKEIDENGLRVDALGIHHYGEPNADVFKQEMQSIYEKYNRRPLLLTELAVADWDASSVETNRFKPDRVLKFMQQILPWMEEQDWILGYAWYSFDIDDPNGTSSALFKDSKSNLDDAVLALTPLGQYYSAFKKGTSISENAAEIIMSRPSDIDEEDEQSKPIISRSMSMSMSMTKMIVI